MEPQLNPEQQESIKKLLSQNRKIEAIKLYREFTGLGLKEAKDAIETFEQPTSFLSLDSSLSHDQFKEIETALKNQKKIEAIKLYRTFTGLGLKEGKDFVDEFERQLNPQSTEPVDVSRTGGCLSLFLVFACFGVVCL